MSVINGVGGGLPVQPQNGAIKTNGSHNGLNGSTPKTRSDSVELSGGVEEYLNILRSNDVRSDKVATVRSAIAEGNYEDDYKLDVAIDRLMEDLNA